MKKINVNAEYGINKDWNELDEWQQKAHPYTVTVKYGRKQMTVPFFMGQALTHEPTDKDVIPCLISDYYSAENNSDFEDFCNEFGYHHDSIQALKIFKACQKNAKNLKRVFGDDLDSIIKKYQDL